MTGVDATLAARPTERAGREDLVDYREGQIVPLRISLARATTVRFMAGETIQNVTLGDPTNWRSATNRANDRVTVSAMQVSGQTNMAVQTSRRLYLFALAAQPASAPNPPPRTVRLRDTRPVPIQMFAGPGSQAASVAIYRIRGDMAVRPTSVSDDGVRTYIDWPADASLPAVYAINDAGREALVNGNMRAGRYVIDSLEKHLVFRIDKRVANAVRMLPKQTKR